MNNNENLKLSIVENIKSELKNNPDFVVRKLNTQKPIFLAYLKSMTNDKLISQAVVEPLLRTTNIFTLEVIKDEVLQVLDCEMIEGIQEAIDAILKNNMVVFFEDEERFIKVDVELYVARTPSEPPTSSVLRGPREGFTESIKINIQLIRRRLKTKDLVLKNMFVGKYSNTQVTLCFIKGVASKKIVKKIENQISKINIDGIVSSSYIESLIEEKPYSLFKQVGSTEKPDIACAKLLEGRVAILIDNSPVVLTLPFVYTEDIQDSNDYYGRFYYASYMRWMRILGLFMAVIVPGAYLAMRLYHYKIIPLEFLITISNSNQGLPFTPFVEMLFILILFEILYEVSLRLPKFLGLATSIVGALILGDTGVKAGLISPPGVMIIAMSIIAVYTIPDQGMQLSILRFIFLLLGGTLGFLGMIAGLIYVCNYLNTLTSYSAPYLAPISPYIASDQKDALFKQPLVNMKRRPKSFENDNQVRMRNEEKSN